MTKDIVTRLKELNRKTRSKKNAILECEDEIKKGFDAGFSIKELWLVLEPSGKLPYSYSGFVKAVRKYIEHNTAPPVTPRKKKAVQTPATAPSPPPSSPKPDAGSEKYHVYRPPPPEPKRVVEESPDVLTDEQAAEMTARIKAAQRMHRP